MQMDNLTNDGYRLFYERAIREISRRVSEG